MEQTARVMELLESGCNCSQAILAGFGAAQGLDEATAMHLGRAFGGGLGRQGLVCGAVSGAVMVLGLAGQGREGQELELRGVSYQAVREFLDRFRQLHGALECRELLGVDISTDEGFRQFKEGKLFASRCVGLVRDAAGILEGML